MLRPLALLLPALVPSWNFFDVIVPSPRVEFALTPTRDASAADWREFRPRPWRHSLAGTIRRLIWNPRWNENLFLVSCAERLAEHPTAHSEDEIFRRIAADLRRRSEKDAGWLGFRLVFVRRDGESLTREVLFQAAPRTLADL